MLSPSPSASPSLSPTPQHAGIIVVYQRLTEETFTASKFEAIHEATVLNGKLTDRVVSADPGGELTAASDSYAFVVAPRPGDQNAISNGPQPVRIELSFGIRHRYEPGPEATTCILPSPDQSQILVCSFDGNGGGNSRLQIVDVRSGAIRGLGPGFTPPFNPVPVAWTNGGLLMCCCPASPCWNVLAYLFDPTTSTVTWTTTYGVVAASPSGDYMGEADNGHPHYGRCHDSIHLVHYTGPTQQATAQLIATAPGKELTIVAVGDDGTMLYTKGDCVSPHTTPTQPSLYYFAAGRSILQADLTVYSPGYYLAATISHGALLDGAAAVIVRSVQPSSNELDLVHLCAKDACRPTTTAIASVSDTQGDYSFTVLS